MTAIDPAPLNSSPSKAAKSFDGLSLLFACAVFLSAFLLFQVQPLIGKAILPWFGGTPGVWTTCMLFFQMLLCGGYLYSHLLTQRIPVRRQGVVHAMVLVGSLVVLNVLPDDSWKPDGSEPPALRILLLLLSTVGLPYFVLSTTGPLLLRWFSDVRPDATPYRLYALSNAGSLLALLSYPFVVEPAMRLSTQATSWSAGYVVFCALCIVCGEVARRSVGRIQAAVVNSGDSVPLSADRVSADRSQVPAKKSATSSKRGQTESRRSSVWQWFVLSMIASAMLLAETNEVCQDVAVIPFLWVIPLALYLLSFILCFESDRWYHRRFFAITTSLLVLAVCWLQSFGTRTYLPVQLLIYFGCLFSVCMLCHGELARLRPEATRLTAFYLTLSAGGAAGGLFVGLLAPMIFPAFWEHYLGMIVASVLSMIVLLDAGGSTRSHRPSVMILVPFVILLVATGTIFASAVMSYSQSVAMTRNFYGVLEVEDDDIEDAIVLRHGRILHGLQLKKIPSLPTMYYGYNTGVGLAIADLRESRPTLRVGLVGLGAGTLAAYAKNDDMFRFYEINEAVTELARKHFTFLERSPVPIEIIHGDARLQLEHEQDQSFDLLVLDAFSGDAIPTHLLTTEAMKVYVRHLMPDGILAFHISNLHFDLRRITESLSEDAGLHCITLESPPATDPVTGQASIASPGSRWVLMARDRQLLDRPRFESTKLRSALPDDQKVRWTDDFSNLIEVMYW